MGVDLEDESYVDELGNLNCLTSDKIYQIDDRYCIYVPTYFRTATFVDLNKIKKTKSKTVYYSSNSTLCPVYRCKRLFFVLNALLYSFVKVFRSCLQTEETASRVLELVKSYLMLFAVYIH